jgi:cytochrome c
MKLLALLLTLAGSSLAASAASPDEQTTRLAKDRNCTFCHAFQPARAELGAVPPAPAFSDIAKRYRGQPGAEDKLVAVVMRGSNPGDRHWAGKVSAAEMPPNPARISEADARQLIRWILR